MKQSVNQELNKKQKRFGLPSGDALFGDYSMCDGIEPNTDYITSLVSGFFEVCSVIL